MRCRVSLIVFFLSAATLAGQDLGMVRELKQLWKYDEAIASLTQMMAEQGPRAELLEELADCHYQSGNAAEALTQYSLLADMQPDKLLYKLRSSFHGSTGCDQVVNQNNLLTRLDGILVHLDDSAAILEIILHLNGLSR